MRYANEIALTILILVLLVFLWNPWLLWMPSQLNYMIAAALAVIVLLYAGLVLRGKPEDEREEKLLAQAGRFGFIAGVAVISIGIIFQTITSKPDIFLIAALAVMVLAKVFSYKGKI